MQTGKGTKRQNEKGNAAANVCYRLRTTFIFWFLSVAAPESFPRNENEPVSRVKEKVIAPLPPPTGRRDSSEEYICVNLRRGSFGFAKQKMRMMKIATTKASTASPISPRILSRSACPLAVLVVEDLLLLLLLLVRLRFRVKGIKESSESG